MTIATLEVRSRASFSLNYYSRGRPNWETQIETYQNKKGDEMARETNAFVDKLKNSKKSALVSLIF